MSKKANNLRKRLRIEEERKPKLDRMYSQLSSTKRHLEDELTKAVALTIRIDQDCRSWGEVFAITTTFRPEMFRHQILRQRGRYGPSINAVSEEAGRIAEELADKVRRAIVKFVESGKVEAGR